MGKYKWQNEFCLGALRQLKEMFSLRRSVGVVHHRWVNLTEVSQSVRLLRDVDEHVEMVPTVILSQENKIWVAILTV